MTRTEELLRDALAAEAEQYQASPDLWSRIAERRRRSRRFLVPLVVAAASLIVVGIVALLRDDTKEERVATMPSVVTSVTGAPSGGRCPDIHFEPNTSNMASNIKSGTAGGYPPNPERNCRVAEDLIRDVATAHNFVTGPRDFHHDPAWRCTVVTEEEELPVGHYVCYQSTYRVSWDKT